MTAGDALGGRAGRFPHVLFGLVVALLALLALWWFWFMAQAVRTEDALWQETVRLELRIIERELIAHPPSPEMFPNGSGVVPGHPRFTLSHGPPPAMRGGSPWRAELSREAKEEHDSAIRRRKLMIYGEGSFLLLLVLGCVAMLYRLVLAEQQYRRDTDDFMGRVTHEMKTPLAGLKAMLQTLRDGRVPPERLAEVAELGLRQAEREEHLIENLLTAHRLTTRAAHVETSDLDLTELLHAFVAHRRQTMGHEADGLVLACPAGLRARGNASALQTILENLADNAFKYGASRLRVDATCEAACARIVVSDDGEGFDPSQATGIFRPFRRGMDATRSGRHGTGLGLPIALALAQEMGGSLAASSEGPGRGATFVLRLRSAGEVAT
jgi:signal transduction histidine kinase